MGDGDHLVAIHDHLRGELAQLRELVEPLNRLGFGLSPARAGTPGRDVKSRRPGVVWSSAIGIGL
jgi:hypothetical protein